MDREGVIIGAGIVIVLVGAIASIQEDKNPWPLIGAGVGVMALLSVLAAGGEGPAKIASGLAVVAATSVVLYEGIPLFQFFSSIGREKTT